MKFSDYSLNLEIELSNGKKYERANDFSMLTKSQWIKVIKALPISNEARIILTKSGKVTIFAPDTPDWREKVTYTIKNLTPTHLSQTPLDNT